MKKYTTILCDPPWQYRNKKTGGSMLSGSAQKYDTLSIDELCALNINKIAAKDCVLFLWVTCPMNPEAFRLISEWGYCVGVDTKILTSDLRYIPAKSLKVGDELLSFDEYLDATKGYKCNRRYLKTTRVLSTGIKKLPCYDIYLETGEIIRASSDHLWLMRTSHHGRQAIAKWIKTSDITMHLNHPNRRYPLYFMRIIPKSEPLNSYKAGFLAATFDGEGHLRGRKPILGFSQVQNNFLELVKKYLTDLGYRYTVDSIRNINNLRILGGYNDTFKFLIEMRPPRLLDYWRQKLLLENNIHHISIYNKESVAVQKIINVGMQKVVALQTDSATYIAEGFGAHNTFKTKLYWRKIMSLGLGYYFRGQVEELWVCIRGKVKAFRCQKPNFIQTKALKHSEKPEEMYGLIESYCAKPRIELFARRKRIGWDAIGLEIDGRDIRNVLK